MEKMNMKPEETKLENMNHQTFERIMALMNYYKSEFEYRNMHCWKLLIRFFTLNTVLSLMPFVDGIAGIEFSDSLANASYIFPIVGILIAIFSWIILCAETKRMRYVNRIKYQINEKLPEDCRYIIFSDLEEKHHHKFVSKVTESMAGHVYRTVAAIELCISILSLVLVFVI